MKKVLCKSLLIVALLTFQTAIFAQSTNVAEKAMPSVVSVLTGKGDGQLDNLGTGIIVQSNGVILTAYHVVKDATQVQIRLKNGEIYDKVDLLSFDERRDVAALKISASDLPAITISNEETKIGDKVFVISNPRSLGWTFADGVLSATRLADEIPNAGQGFRVLQFSAPVSAGSSGGLLTNANGQAIGLIVASMSSGQNLNFAIPISAVKGLADSTNKIMSFGNASALELPQAVRPQTASAIINSDPQEMIRNAKIVYIYSNSELISDKMLENALIANSDFARWKMFVVNGWDKRNLADIEISLEHQLFTFDYRYTMTDRRTGIVLASEKVTSWDGKGASNEFAKKIVKKLKELKEPKTETKKDAKKT